MKRTMNVFRIYLSLSIIMILGFCSCDMPWMWSEGEEEFSITPEPIVELKPTHINGNNNLGSTDFEASAVLNYTEKEVYVTLRLSADEYGHDDSRAEGLWIKKIWTVPSPHCTIVGILTSDSSYVAYRDSDEDEYWDILEPTFGSLVSTFDIIGVTPDADLGPDAEWPYVLMNVNFNPVRLKVKISQ
ncbi:hypothetical protein ACFL4L_07090 [bacterium]